MLYFGENAELQKAAEYWKSIWSIPIHWYYYKHS